VLGAFEHDGLVFPKKFEIYYKFLTLYKPKLELWSSGVLHFYDHHSNTPLLHQEKIEINS
jgi:hypothetical protein